MMFEPWLNDGRPTWFECDCGRTFVAIPPLNPLNGPSFFDGDRVVSHCPECGLDLSWVLRTATPAGQREGCRPAPRASDSARTPSSLRPAGESSRLPAGPLGRVEWTLTRYPDGRVVYEEGQ